MLTRRKKHRPWLKGEAEALALLTHIVKKHEDHHESLEKSVQGLGALIGDYTHAEGYAVYRFNPSKKCFSLYTSYGHDEVFTLQAEFHEQDITDCTLQLEECATISNISERQDAGDALLLKACIEASVHSLAYVPIVVNGSLQTVLWFAGKQQHRNSEADRQFFTILTEHLRLCEEKALLAKQFEEDVSNKVSQLQESEERYRVLIENVNEIVFQADPKGTILFVNHRVQDILGYTPDEITGTNFFTRVIPTDLEEAKAAFRLTMRNERPLSGEFRVMHKNGRKLTISIYTRPIFEDGRRPVGMLAIVQDMTTPSEHRLPDRDGLHELIGRSRKMQEIYELITSVAKTDSTVLIHGESGTGKELIAQAVHASSPRHNKPFIVVNCAAYSEHLLESELFGHERGAFTGAHRRKLGRFELAKGGTIFLDEIGEIPPHSQVLLLRVLQNRTFERVGGEKTLETDVRIVAATNKNLEQEMKAGRFRGDLYYRLNVIPIEVPPLRERKEDIPHLVEHFRKKYSEATHKQVLNCSQGALEILMRYSWYGNVRELENTIERAVVMTSGSVIGPADLPLKLRQESDFELQESAICADEPPPTSLYEHEKALIKKTLQALKWNKYQAAKALGITRSTLYSKIRKYKLESGDVS
ncbi:ATPase [candidate division KSB3 bacterium]|uniref:ATPase n=1 Tax=candidate division KSB3 bacterium TaxID=2044937 RepID=A0A2G6E4X4_9BACT|nr:MAG: ATPase [candidate division KSB3 bacterium]PIE28362.1 MAG: ATPase [candidate division KSB3 bacterium]